MSKIGSKCEFSVNVNSLSHQLIIGLSAGLEFRLLGMINLLDIIKIITLDCNCFQRVNTCDGSWSKFTWKEYEHNLAFPH